MTSRRGISSIKLLVALPAMIAFTWLGIEFGLVLRSLQQSKIAADAGALAAAARLPEGFAVFRDSAMLATSGNTGAGGDLIIEVPGDLPGGDLHTGTWDSENRIFTADPDARDAVKVTVRVGGNAPNSAPGFLLPNILSLADITFERSGIATWNPRPASTSLLLLEASSKNALSLSQASLQDSFGEVAVVSTSSQAAKIGDSALLQTPALRITGDLLPGDASNVEGTIEIGADPLDDPFVGIPFTINKNLASPPPDLAPGEVFDLESGRHPGGVTVSTGTLRLLPGVHQFGGLGLQITGNAEVVLVDAMIQLLDSGNLLIQDFGRLTGDPIIGDDWADALLITAAASTITLSDDATILSPGFIYGPSATVRMSDDAAMVIDGGVLKRWIQTENSTTRFDRIILTSTEMDSGRASLRR
ncbi:MAG: hypothetical protein CMJ23_09510 [Phycisphaerae bacterium]|nr:hypothetical protein [Phycisphaerae bacterium]